VTSAIGGPSAARTRSGWRGRTWVLVSLAVVLVGTACGLAIASSGGASSAAASVPMRPAPVFVLAPVAGSGPAVTLAGADGRAVMLSFFASWCDGCQTEMATMAQVSRLAGGVRVIGIDVNDSVGPARSLLRGDHIAYSVGSDSNGAVASSYRLVGLPSTVFLDARHLIVGEAIGPLTVATAQRWLDRLAAS
jgi:cytochrome c biogenesis protein CcmG/thiol:disulfide interchange protein DsbE